MHILEEPYKNDLKGARTAQSKDRKKAKSEKLVQSVQISNQEYSQFVCESKETTEEIKEKVSSAFKRLARCVCAFKRTYSEG